MCYVEIGADISKERAVSLIRASFDFALKVCIFVQRKSVVISLPHCMASRLIR